MNHRNRVACSALLAVLVLAQMFDKGAAMWALVAALAREDQAAAHAER